MISFENILNLIRFRGKLFLNDLGFGSVRFYISITGHLFGIAFFFLTLFTLLAFDKNSYIAIVAVLPLLLQLSFGQQSVSKFNPSKSLALSQFVKNTPIPQRDRVVFTLIHDIFFSLKFWIGLTFAFLFSLLFFRFSLFVTLFGLTVYGISFIVVNCIFDIVQYLTLHKRKIVRGIGFIFNILISILPVFLFISLFSLIGGASSESILVLLLQYFSIQLFSLPPYYFFILFSCFLLIIFVYYFVEYFNLSNLYFYDNEGKTSSSHISKPLLLPRGILFDNPIGAVIVKDFKWISKFPGIYLQFFYPLVFIVVASVFFLKNVTGFSNSFFETFYLIIAIGNLNFLLDNQLSIYSKFFIFDVSHKIQIIHYFISKCIISLFILSITLGGFLFLNKYLDLGYEVTQRIIAGFFFYVLALNCKGILVSLFDINPFDYSQGQLKVKRSGCFNSLLITFLNLVLMIPLFVLFIANIPVILIFLSIFAGLLFYIITLFIASKVFNHRYYNVIHSFSSI